MGQQSSACITCPLELVRMCAGRCVRNWPDSSVVRMLRPRKLSKGQAAGLPEEVDHAGDCCSCPNLTLVTRLGGEGADFDAALRLVVHDDDKLRSLAGLRA